MMMMTANAYSIVNCSDVACELVEEICEAILKVDYVSEGTPSLILHQKEFTEEYNDPDSISFVQKYASVIPFIWKDYI